MQNRKDLTRSCKGEVTILALRRLQFTTLLFMFHIPFLFPPPPPPPLPWPLQGASTLAARGLCGDAKGYNCATALRNGVMEDRNS
ncbi:hypothetical protein E2C01_071775 [Portunus trituberculatus]|uniref:Uncharacterized protein n=1 Tax=Portunus trituberculatus TaxID=210409 RepID=A0A5B7I4U0_PORTR|nr:hypothetical protein [Portunus trituberculatus]